MYHLIVVCLWFKSQENRRKFGLKYSSKWYERWFVEEFKCLDLKMGNYFTFVAKEFQADFDRQASIQPLPNCWRKVNWCLRALEVNIDFSENAIIWFIFTMNTLDSQERIAPSVKQIYPVVVLYDRPVGQTTSW